MDVKTTLTQPLYAAAGAGDLAVAKLRELPAEYDRLQQEAKKVDAGTLRVALEDYSTKVAGSALSGYGALVNRGEKLVSSIRGQQATQDLQEQLSRTEAQVKGAVTTTRRARKQATSSTKGAATSTRKSATATRRAVRSSAKKVG